MKSASPKMTVKWKLFALEYLKGVAESMKPGGEAGIRTLGTAFDRTTV